MRVILEGCYVPFKLRPENVLELDWLEFNRSNADGYLTPPPSSSPPIHMLCSTFSIQCNSFSGTAIISLYLHEYNVFVIYRCVYNTFVAGRRKGLFLYAGRQL